MAVVISTSVGNVRLEEQWEGYEKGIDITQGPWVMKPYTCPWGVSDAVTNALMGKVFLSTLGAPPSYLFPHACPESPNLFCLDARADGIGEVDDRAGGRPKYVLAKIHARYGVPLKYDFQNSDPSQAQNGFDNDASPGTPFLYAMQSIDFDTELVKLPGSAYTFEFPTVPNDTPVTRSVGVADMVFVRKLVPYFPYNQLFSLMNTLNATTFLGQPKGQIKFRKFRTRREISSDGTRTQEIELHFKWREYDHNKFHRPDRRNFDYLVDPSGNKVYDYTDLTPTLS
jgi:hypothetical protein